MDGGCQVPVSVTWNDLLRKMKAEFKEIGYAQVPKVTTSRKIDLNKPFSLSPETFDPKKNKKRSLLIGCNYQELKDAELKASHDDIRSMKVRTLLTFPILIDSVKMHISLTYAFLPLIGLYCECT